MKDYYVADNQGNIAGHDLDYDHAREVLAKQLELDAENSREWEILQVSSGPKPLWCYIYEKHTEYNAGCSGGYDSEQAEQQLIEEAVDKINVPQRKELYSWLKVKPEDLRNNDEETDVALLKAAVEYTIGSLCLNHLLTAENEKYTASQRYLETLTVCITLTDNWQEMFN